MSAFQQTRRSQSVILRMILAAFLLIFSCTSPLLAQTEHPKAEPARIESANAAPAEAESAELEGSEQSVPAAPLPRFVLPSAGTLPIAPMESSTLPEPGKVQGKAPQVKVPSDVEAGRLPALPGTAAPAATSSNSSSTTTVTNSATLNPASTKPSPAGAMLGANVNSDSAKQSTTSAHGASLVISAPAPVPLVSIYRGSQTVPQELTLPNGLKVLILENHEFPVVSTLVWYKVGSRDERAGATGLSHMVEHLMFQEVGQFKSGEIGTTIARMGGQFNGYTSDDFTTFFETLPSSRLELALKIESERMAHTRFSDSEVKAEVENIQREFLNETKDPAALLSKELRSVLFTHHPYHNPTIGWKSDVEGLTAEHAREFYKKFFRPNNATLVITGDVNGKNAIALVQKYFAPIVGSKATVAHVQVNEPFPHAERKVNLKYGGNKEVLQVAYRAPAMEDADAPAMVVIERLLNGGHFGRLRSKLVDAHVCSYAQANYEIKKDPGLFTLTCTAIPATPNAQAKILENLDSVLAQLREKVPSDAEIRRARNQAEFAYYSECDGPYRAGFHLGYFDSLDKWQNSYTWPERLKSVSAQDVVRVSKKYFGSDARVVGWIAGSAAPKPASPKPSNNLGAPSSSRLLSLGAPPIYDCRLLSLGAPPIYDCRLLSPVAYEKKAKNMASRQLEHVHLTGFKEDDNASGARKKNVLPPVIRDIPAALGNAVTGNIPNAVNNVGNAIISIPNAIGGIPNAIGEFGNAVGNTAQALGKQISQFKLGGEQDSRISKRVLKNGVTVLVFESHLSPIVQIAGSVQAGDAYVPRNKSGLSVMASSLLNQGSSKRQRAQMISQQDDLGIASGHMLRWENGHETIDFSARCLTRDLNTELNLLAESLATPALDEANLDKAKLEAVSFLKRNEESVNQKVDRVLLQNLLDENSPFCPPDPTEKLKTISQATLPDLEKFFSTHVVPGAVTLVVAGDVQADQVFAQAEGIFSRWNTGANHNTLRAKARVQKILRASLPIKDSKKSSVCFGQLVPLSETHSDYGSLLIADGVLVNHPMVSRFEQALSKNAALENAISSGDFTVKLEPISNMTRWSMSLAVDPTLVPVSVKTIKHELRQLSQTGVTAEEFNEVKRYLIGSLLVKKQGTLETISDAIVESAERSDTANGFNLTYNSLKNASIDSVNRVIRGVFKPEQSLIVIAGGGQSIKAVRKQEINAGSGTGSKSELNPQAAPVHASPASEKQSALESLEKKANSDAGLIPTVKK